MTEREIKEKIALTPEQMKWMKLFEYAYKKCEDSGIYMFKLFELNEGLVFAINGNSLKGKDDGEFVDLFKYEKHIYEVKNAWILDRIDLVEEYL